MKLVATMRTGDEVALAAKYKTVKGLVDEITADSITGSAFVEAEIETADGRTVKWLDINVLEER